MSALGALFVALIVLYLLECLVIVPDEALVLVEGWDGHWHTSSAGFALGALRRRAILASLLRPNAGVVVVPQWPVALSPTGMVVRDAHQSPRVLRYATVGVVEVHDDALRCDAGTLTVYSRRRARWLARWIRVLREVPEAARGAVIDRALGEATNVDDIAGRVAAYRRSSRSLRLISATLAIHLFVAWPLLINWLGLQPIWIAILGELAIFVGIIAWLFVRARRTLPGTETQDDVVPLVTLALSPPAAARAATNLTRDLLGDVHPLAATLALCRKAEAVALAASAQRDGPRAAPADAADAREIEAWFDTRWREHQARLIAQTVGTDSVPTAPAQDNVSGSYCPRCWTQYAEAAGRCADCEDVALVSF
jgi:hypothetical protein